MQISAQIRELARLSLLRHLDAAAGTVAGLSESILQAQLRAEGVPLSAEPLRAELQYLQDKGFVRPAEKQISPELKLWQITASGRDFFATT